MTKRNRNFTKQQRREIFDRDGGKCQHCGPEAGPLDFEDKSAWQPDHIVAWSLGGPTTTDNGQVLCSAHNMEKGAIDDEEARARSHFRRRYRGGLAGLASSADRSSAAFLARAYDRAVRDRVAHQNAAAAAEREGLPSAVQRHMESRARLVESDLAKAIEAYAGSTVTGRWCMSHVGCGALIAGQLVAMIDVGEQAQRDGTTRYITCGSLWRFAGLDPSAEKPRKGVKRNFNMRLKTVVVGHLAESFVKSKNKPGAFYGKLMEQHKQGVLIPKNEAGEYADAARKALEDKPDHAQRAVYAQGKLPAGHIHSRAKRWIAKLFLSHFYEVAYYEKYGEPCPRPYVFEHMGHVHRIPVPNWPWETEGEELRAAS